MTLLLRSFTARCSLGLSAAALGLAFALASGCSTQPFTPIVFPPITSLDLVAEADTLRVGEIKAFAAVARDSNGAVVSGVPIAWSSSNTSIFTVDGAGRVRGRGEGTALLTAVVGTARDSAWVTVQPIQSGWFIQFTSGSGENLNAVFFQPDGRSGCVVGNGGRILTTTDAGVTWTVRSSGTLFSLHGVWFTSNLVGWAVGTGGTVLRTVNGGASWTRIDAGSGEALRDVVFATADSGWAVGAAGLVLRTTDGGQTWERRFPTAFALNSVSFAGTLHGWAVGDGGVILGTHNGGASWFIVQPAVTSQSLRGVWRRSEPKAVAAGAQGVTPRTVSGADSTIWQLANAGAANALEDVIFPTDVIGFAVGYNGGGAVLRTGDGGATWQAQLATTSQRLNGVFFVDALRGWAVADNGVIIHTGTGGAP